MFGTLKGAGSDFCDASDLSEDMLVLLQNQKDANPLLAKLQTTRSNARTKYIYTTPNMKMA